MAIRRIVWIVCIAQFLTQLGAFAVPALLPSFIQTWSLSNSQAGWITGIFYAGYTLSVPILVSLTDRLPAKWIYLGAAATTAAAHLGYAYAADGFWSALMFRLLAGIGWAGAYMPGLKALSDLVEGPGQSRAVAAHAASVGISGALSFIMAAVIADFAGWRWALAAGGIAALGSFFLILLYLPSQQPKPAAVTRALLDFRPVFRNRSAMAYAIGYGLHTWEMSAVRQWGVTFLTFAALGGGAAVDLISPALAISAMGLFGVAASMMGNELARRYGRRRLILTVMCLGVVVSALTGFSAGISYLAAVTMVMIFAALIWADSSSLTAGAVGTAAPGQRGATMAVHSTLGYAGGFMGPLAVGFILDAVNTDSGGGSVLAWGLAFCHLALVGAVGALAITLLRPKGLAGDRDA